MITENLLIHRAKVYTQISMDTDRKTVYDSPIELERVRFNSTKNRTIGATGEIQQDKLIMYFDCEYSLPIGFIPKEGQILEWEYKTYTIREIKAAYALNDSIEFYRVFLI